MSDTPAVSDPKLFLCASALALTDHAQADFQIDLSNGGSSEADRHSQAGVCVAIPALELKGKP